MVTCECCGQSETEPTKHTNVLGLGADLVRCVICGVKFYNRPAATLPPEFYGGHAYDEYARNDDAMGSPCNLDPGAIAMHRDVVARLYRSYLDRLERVAKRPIGTLYEVGFGAARFLAEAKARGIVAAGCDMNAVDVELGRATGASCELASFQDASVNLDLDCVVMLDVIEHTLTPRADLQKAHRHLRPGGALLVKTFYDEWHETLPNLDVASPRSATKPGHTTAYFCPVSHPFHFDEPILRSLIERCGFAIVEWQRDEAWGQVAAFAVKA